MIDPGNPYRAFHRVYQDTATRLDRPRVHTAHATVARELAKRKTLAHDEAAAVIHSPSAKTPQRPRRPRSAGVWRSEQPTGWKVAVLSAKLGFACCRLACTIIADNSALLSYLENRAAGNRGSLCTLRVCIILPLPSLFCVRRETVFLHLSRRLARSSAILVTLAALFIFTTPASAMPTSSVAPTVKRIIPQTVCWPTTTQPKGNRAFILLGSGLTGASVTTDAPIFLPRNGTGVDFAGHVLAQIFAIGVPPSPTPTGTFHLVVTTPSGTTSVPFTLRVCRASGQPQMLPPYPEQRGNGGRPLMTR